MICFEKHHERIQNLIRIVAYRGEGDRVALINRQRDNPENAAGGGVATVLAQCDIKTRILDRLDKECGGTGVKPVLR